MHLQKRNVICFALGCYGVRIRPKMTAHCFHLNSIVPVRRSQPVNGQPYQYGNHPRYLPACPSSCGLGVSLSCARCSLTPKPPESHPRHFTASFLFYFPVHFSSALFDISRLSYPILSPLSGLPQNTDWKCCSSMPSEQRGYPSPRAPAPLR
ncbi:hypothetical protein BGZ63DRAFT_129991 [Mariannaea sp. PMI_226]|nr:hypothetical protein BGZ63DRAFT_129991 [Mariannaea sp. PMI_226]